MTKYFEKAHEFTALWEGGLVDHKNDPGGITNHGISLRFLQELATKTKDQCLKQAATCDGSNTWDTPYDFNADHIIDANDIRACTKEQAEKLMFQNFWEPLNCQHLPLPLGVVLYDSAVNMGPARATRIVQEVLNVVGEAHLDDFTSIKVDGACGPKTITLSASLREFGLDFYAARMAVRNRISFYNSLCRKNEKLTVFLQGWKNRCQALLEHLSLIERGL